MLLSALMLGSLGFRFAPTQTAASPKIYTVATAHLDTNWLWTIQDTINEHLPKTLKSNFDLFDKYPDYVFNFEGAFRYQLIKEYYPEQYAKLKQAIAAGRWKVAGSWVDAVDANMPSPESLVRQTLYGDGFFQDEFGKRSQDVFLPDCFGFPFSLPTIAQHCGLIGFSTQKLGWGSAAGIPFPVGRWQGVDGRSLVAALDPGSYGTTLAPNLDNDPQILGMAKAVGDASGAYVAYRYHGTGDTGGAPSEESVKNLEANIKSPGKMTAVSASSDQLFRDLTPAEVAKLPSYTGELVLTTHGTGCYTSQAAMKRWNRENEGLAKMAEASAETADWLGGAKYPGSTLKTAWIRFLWHQFHDDLTGTSIPEVYPFSWNDEVLSLNNFAEVAKSSLAVLTAAADTSEVGTPILVYNAAGCGRVDAVEATLDVPGAWTHLRVLDPDGAEVPCQINQRNGATVKLLFTAHVPAMGYGVYHVIPSALAPTQDPGMLASASGIETRDYSIKLDKDGNVSSIYDKSVRKELLTGPILWELRDDYSPDWPSWEIKYPTVNLAPRAVVSGPANLRVIEQGPARFGIETTRTTEGSTFTQRIYVTPGNGRIDFVNHVDWRTPGTLLKVDFPLAATNTQATYDLGMGVVERGINTPLKYEVPAQKWADQTAADGSFGVTVANDCKYGWDKPDAGHLRLTLLHTAKPGDDFKFQATNDMGQHDFTYSIYSHPGDWKNGSWKVATGLNQPLIPVVTDRHQGTLDSEFSLVDSNSPQIEVLAVKKSEHDGRMIIRVVEKAGQPLKDGVLVFPSNVQKATEMNGQEDPVTSGTPLKTKGNELHFDLTPFQPRAFAIELGGPRRSSGNGTAAIARKATRLVPVKSTPIKLALDTSLVSTAGVKRPATGPEYAIPAELFPATLDCEGVKFTMGSHDLNAMSCAGQSLTVPKGTRNVELLITSTGGDKSATFHLGEDQTLDVPSYSRRIAQWTNRITSAGLQTDPSKFLPAFLKRTPVGWVATHRLKADGSVEAYKYILLFKVTLAVTDGATTLVLPNDPDLKLFAATAVEDTKPVSTVATELYH